MRRVRMIHPDVGESEVPESAVPHWRASGWQIAHDQGGALPSGRAQATATEPESVLTEEQIETPRRRRKAKEE